MGPIVVLPTSEEGQTAILVLSRKIGEEIVVPDLGLSVTVVAVVGNRVRLGISSPAEILVYSSELRHSFHPQKYRSPTEESKEAGKDGDYQRE
jgi:carbon storage regulator CsrA